MEVWVLPPSLDGRVTKLKKGKHCHKTKEDEENILPFAQDKHVDPDASRPGTGHTDIDSGRQVERDIRDTDVEDERDVRDTDVEDERDIRDTDVEDERAYETRTWKMTSKMNIMRISTSTKTTM